MIAIKPGVRLLGVNPAMSIALLIVAEVYREHGYDCTLTSCIEGKHSRASKHYTGYAMDFRVRHIPPGDRRMIADSISERLGPEFDAILEGGVGPHIHVEYDPKDPLT